MDKTGHEIYKRRGRMNIQIGLVLGGFVLLVMIATMARLSSPPVEEGAKDENISNIEAQTENEAGQ